MGIETATPQINPQGTPGLIVPITPVATPGAVQALSDAFRSGFITSKEIVDSLGSVGQAKRKAELMSLNEAASPDAIAARAATLRAASAVAGQNTMLANEAMSPEGIAARKTAAALAEDTKRKASADLTYQQSLSSYYAHNRLPIYQIDPVTGLPDKNKPDNETMAAFGAKLARAEDDKKEAIEGITGTPTQVPSKDGKSHVTVSLNRWGQDVGRGTKWNNTYSNMYTKAREILSSEPEIPKPNKPAAGTSPIAAPVPAPAIVVPRVQAMGPPFGPVIESALGFVPDFQGTPAFKDDKPIPAEGVEKLSLARQAKATVADFRQAYENLVKNDPEFVGIVAGRAASAAGAKRWKESVANFHREGVALLAPLAKGAFGETGVLSEKDVARYEGILPVLQDSPAVGHAKMEKLFADVNASYELKKDTWTRAGYDTSGFDDTAPGTVSAPVVRPEEGIVLPGRPGRYKQTGPFSYQRVQ